MNQITQVQYRHTHKSVHQTPRIEYMSGIYFLTASLPREGNDLHCACLTGAVHPTHSGVLSDELAESNQRSSVPFAESNCVRPSRHTYLRGRGHVYLRSLAALRASAICRRRCATAAGTTDALASSLTQRVKSLVSLSCSFA